MRRGLRPIPLQGSVSFTARGTATKVFLQFALGPPQIYSVGPVSDCPRWSTFLGLYGTRGSMELAKDDIWSFRMLHFPWNLTSVSDFPESSRRPRHCTFRGTVSASSQNAFYQSPFQSNTYIYIYVCIHANYKNPHTSIVRISSIVRILITSIQQQQPSSPRFSREKLFSAPSASAGAMVEPPPPAPASKRPRRARKDPLAACRGTGKVLILDGRSACSHSH